MRFQRCRFFASLRGSVSNLKRYNPRSNFHSFSYHKASSSNNKRYPFQIIQIITVFKTYECLGKSNIEGIEVLARQFHTVSMNVKRKQYDMLAPRTAEFETDFAKFMTQVSHIEVCISSCFSESATCSGTSRPYCQSPYFYSVDYYIKLFYHPYLQNQLRTFMNSCFSNIITSQQSLCLIQRSVYNKIQL